MIVPAALAPFLDVIFGLRPARSARAAHSDAADATLAYDLFREGFDSRDIARGLDVAEWRAVDLVAQGRAAFRASRQSARPA